MEKNLRKSTIQFGGGKPLFALFVGTLIFNILWQTGLTLRFSEVPIWPNYNMLAKAFYDGRVSIAEPPEEDYLNYNGKRYLYYGPLPALLRLPLLPALPNGLPTGFMVALFCAGCAYLFARILAFLNKRPGDNTRAWFVFLFIANGYSLFMVGVPSIHDEAIATAMFFLLLSALLIISIAKKDGPPTLVQSFYLALSLSLSISSRLSYIFSAGLLGVLFLWKLWVSRGKGPKRTIYPQICAFLGITGAAGGLLLYYNYLRFGSLVDFGIKHQISLYEHSSFIAYEHVPYQLWTLFFRLPSTIADFPYLALPYYTLKAESVGFPAYTLSYSNELSVSIFLMAPISLALFLPLFKKFKWTDDGPKFLFRVMCGLLLLQVISISITILTAPRFYYDFLPILFIACFLAVTQFGETAAAITKTLIFASVTISAFLLTVSLSLFLPSIQLASPLLGLLDKLGLVIRLSH